LICSKKKHLAEQNRTFY